MNLPDDSIGPTDIQAYRDCPRRMQFGLRRHTEEGEAPEAQSPSTAYGTAVHEAIAFAEEDTATDEQAIQHAFDRYSPWLELDDLERMRADLATYRDRDLRGVRTVAVEKELRIPLTVINGRQVHLRTRIDRLYQRLDNPSIFYHVDYKSSRHARSQKEIDEDRQLWITNLIVHEVYPECETLHQLYDQLNYGQLPTRKSDHQRQEIRAWLIKQVTAIVNDAEAEPKLNDWCPWCPIMESCPVVERLSEYALARISALAPVRKDGRKTVIDLDPTKFDIYVDELGRVDLALRILERFSERIRKDLKEMPAADLDAYGFRITRRRSSFLDAEGMRAAHETLGDDDFYRLANLSKTAVEKIGDERSEAVAGMYVSTDGPAVLKRKERD